MKWSFAASILQSVDTARAESSSRTQFGNTRERIVQDFRSDSIEICHRKNRLPLITMLLENESLLLVSRQLLLLFLSARFPAYPWSISRSFVLRDPILNIREAKLLDSAPRVPFL